MTDLPMSLKTTPAMGQWISFEQQGFVTLRTGKVELGQGILTALAQIAADGLGTDLGRILPQSADTDLSPNEGMTVGSLSVEVSGGSIRLAAAQARMALLKAAAQRLEVPLDRVKSEDGTILKDGEPTGLTFWSLSGDVDWSLPVTGDVAGAPNSLVGSSPPRIDLAAKYTGGGFIHDMVIDGMQHVRIIRQPSRLARLVAVDEAFLTRRHPAVSVYRKADFLALIGADEYAVEMALSEADRFVTWDNDTGRWTPPETAEPEVFVQGDATAGAAEAGSKTLVARYSRPNIAHGSIGPSCALAVYDRDRVTVWCHSQGIFELRAEIARCLSLETSQVRVIHAHGAGCYGHNGADDVGLDAAIVAFAHQGQPVRVQWSRSDELGRGPVGAAMSAQIEATLSDEGRIASWRMEVDSASHVQRPGANGYINLTSAEALDPDNAPKLIADLPAMRGGGASRNSVANYDFPQHVTVRLDASSPVRTSSLRSLAANLNVFAIESAMDELADMAGADPLAFRLDHLSDPRARAVLTEVADLAAWAPDALGGDGEGRGIAVARYKNKGCWLAAVADVEVDETVRVKRLWLVCDAGLLINPAGALSQIEGGAIQTTSWTLKEAVPVEDGQIPPLDWESYPILRFSELPRIETRFIVNPENPPLGAGEATQGPVAAAIGNAVARALGQRMRDLPLSRDRLMAMLLSD